jgi:hypothetical protein
MDERDTTAVIDRTLARGGAFATDAIERELEQLTVALAAEAPSADPDFERQLDERVRSGFPRDGRLDRLRFLRARAARHVPAALRRRPALTALGGIASALVALAIGVGLLGGDRGATLVGDAPSGSEERGSAQAPPPLADGVGAAGGSTRRPLASDLPSDDAGLAPGVTAELAPDGAVADVPLLRAAPGPRNRGGFAPGRSDRRIERSATLTLAAPADELDRVAEQVNAVTERHRGFVLRSSLATGEEGATSGGTFELRIPAARLQAALADLAKLGQVRARTQAGQDVTAAFVTAGDRLEAARAERESLLTRLAGAQTDAEVESLRLQLDANAAEINRLRGHIRSLRVRTRYASVAVALEADEASAGSDDDGGGIGGAADDALDSLGASLELAIRILGVAVPLGLVAGVAWLAVRAVRRRRREAALS